MWGYDFAISCTEAGETKFPHKSGKEKEYFQVIRWDQGSSMFTPTLGPLTT